jgi:hypothetical protein
MKQLACLLLSATLAPLCAQATIYTSIIIDAGWYQDSGMGHVGAPPVNYIVGRVGTGNGYVQDRDFFVFDLSSLPAGSIVSATMSIYNPGYSQGDPGNGFSGINSETLVLGSVAMDIGTLISGTGGVPAYNVLGSGTSWGTQTVSDADNGRYVSVSLNSTFINAADSQLGSGSIVIGGHLLGDSTGTLQNYLFAFTGFYGSQYPAQPPVMLTFDIIPVPEPTVLILLVGLTLSGYIYKLARRP